MIETTLELLFTLLTLLLMATWRSLPLLALVLILDRLLQRRISPRYQVVLWSLVAVRLVLPISIATPLSLQGPVDRWVTAWASSSSEVSTVSLYNAEPLPEAVLASRSEFKDHLASTPILVSKANTALPAAIDWEALIGVSLLAIWSIVAAFLLVRQVVAHFRFARCLKSCPLVQDSEVIELVAQQAAEMGLRRAPQTRWVSQLSAPAVFGLFRPTLCLPAETLKQLSTTELRWVVRHELAHIRRFDSLLLTGASMVQALHWFNPIAWLVTRRLRSLVEQAADETVLRSATAAQAIEYGRLLLRFAEQQPVARTYATLGLLQFVTPSDLKARIARLTHPTHGKQRWTRFIAVVVIAGVGVVGLSDEPEPASGSSTTSNDDSRLHSLEVSIPTAVDSETEVVQAHEIQTVKAKLLELRPNLDVDRFLIAYLSFGGREPATVENNQLHLKTSPSHHQMIEQMLEAMAIAGPHQVIIEVRMISASLEHAQEIDWMGRRVTDVDAPSRSRPMAVAIASDDQMRRMVQGVQSDVRCNVMYAPKVTLFNGQHASISDQVKRPFVTQAEPQADGSAKGICEIIEEGVRFDLQAIVTERGSVRLSCDFLASHLIDVEVATLPYQALDPTTRKLGPVTVQVPSVSTSTLQTQIELQLDESLAIAVPKLRSIESVSSDSESENDQLETMLYTITPRVLDENEMLDQFELQSSDL